MKLIPIPIDEKTLEKWAPHWMPFLPMIAKRSKEPLFTLIHRVMSKEMRLILVWDERINLPTALVGIRLHYRDKDLIGEWLWMVGRGRHSWEHLLPEVEQKMRDAGVKECRPLCRPGWSRILKKHGYRITHVEMEKVL